MENKKAVKTASAPKPQAKETLAVLALGGSQHLIREGTELTVHLLPVKEGVKTKAKVTVIEPSIKEGTATYKVMEHLKGPKVVVMKFKAKSRYRKKMGFRSSLSKIVVEKIEV